jgi:predicted nucleic acid-binding protein
LTRLLAEGAVVMVGLVLVELLRGARTEEDFAVYRRRLEAVPLAPSIPATWLLAGRILFDLARRGETIPLPDAIIAAHALVGDHEVLTKDEHFERVLGLRLRGS